VFFQNNSGQCVLHEVCGCDCISTDTGSYGMFAYILVNNSNSSKNYVNYSSIACCLTENSYSMLSLNFGKICCPSVNISTNKCRYRSGVFCQPYKDSNSVTCSVTHSSFADNNATGYICIYLFTAGASFEITCCNIIRNTQVSLETDGTIRTNGNVTIKDSCILGNKATYIFYQGGSSYTISLSNCTVDLNSNDGYLTTQSTVTKSFILALNHMSTRYCHAEYDTVGTLTKKQKYLCTCGNLFYHSRIRDFVSLLCNFLFNFIHPNASN
jgi:hypothetical protein